MLDDIGDGRRRTGPVNFPGEVVLTCNVRLRTGEAAAECPNVAGCRTASRTGQQRTPLMEESGTQRCLGERVAMPRHLEVLYRDEQLLLVNKPSGWACHRSRECQDKITLIFRIREQLEAPAFLVHRLDRGTSGVIVMGTTRENAAVLSQAFREKRVSKTYLALVRGWPENEFSLTSPIDEKPAHTEFSTLERVELPWPNKRYDTTRLALVQARPTTGLRHQIRRHLRRAGFPIIGDSQHGDKEYNRLLSENCRVRRLLLHAWRLEFPHPSEGRQVVGVAALPGRLRGLLDRLGFSAELVASLRKS